MVDLEYTDPSYQLLAQLQYNTHVFSRFKTHEFVNELVRNLVGDDGKVRSFHEFKKIAEGISEDYNKNWLRTEYDTAIGTGQMAERWKQIEQDADLFPFIQYDTIGDDRVRPEHAALDGVVKRWDDPFWDQYFPPNGWRCRCDVLQVVGPETDLEGDAPDVPKAFRHNPGKTGELFTKDHPYYQTPKAKAAQLETDTAEAMYKPPRLNKEWPAVIAPEFWKLFSERPNISIRKKGGAHYDPEKKRMTITKDFRFQKSDFYKEQVIYHEGGHAIHFQRNLITRDFVDDRVKDVFEKAQAAIKGKEKDLDTRLNKLLNLLRTKDDSFRYRGYNKYALMEMVGSTADTLEALTKGKYGFGHGTRYYRGSARRNFAYMEFFAHACENAYLPAGNIMFDAAMPEVNKLMIDFVKGLER